MEVTVKKLRKPAFFTFYTSNSRCGKCCQVLATKPPNFAFAGSCTLSEYFPSSCYMSLVSSFLGHGVHHVTLILLNQFSAVSLSGFLGSSTCNYSDRLIFGMVDIKSDDVFLLSPCSVNRGQKYKSFKRGTFLRNVLLIIGTVHHTVNFSSFYSFKRSVKCVKLAKLSYLITLHCCFNVGHFWCTLVPCGPVLLLFYCHVCLSFYEQINGYGTNGL